MDASKNILGHKNFLYLNTFDSTYCLDGEGRVENQWTSGYSSWRNGSYVIVGTDIFYPIRDSFVLIFSIKPNSKIQKIELKN